MSVVIIFLFIIIAIIIAFAIYKYKHRSGFKHIQKNPEPNNTCAIGSSCSAKDDVNDPAYNMKNIIKQNILLEEHLAEKNKFCKPCIVKHFLHIIGLAEEAVWMACDQIKKYPLMEDTVDFYEGMMNDWLSDYENQENKLQILAKLRKNRQQLIEFYYFKK